MPSTIVVKQKIAIGAFEEDFHRSFWQGDAFNVAQDGKLSNEGKNYDGQTSKTEIEKI